MKHKIYTDQDSLNEVLTDYPVAYPYLGAEIETIVLVTNINKLLNEDIVNSETVFTASLVNRILDKLEENGDIENELNN